jgi:hypothetical protein
MDDHFRAVKILNSGCTPETPRIPPQLSFIWSLVHFSPQGEFDTKLLLLVAR